MKTNTEPFLGFIVGPYDPALPTPVSRINCFVVQNYRGALTPFAVRWAAGGGDGERKDREGN